MKRINWEALAQALILACCAIAFAVLLITGMIRSYVHPRIEKYAWFAVVVLILMTVSMLPMIRQPKRKSRWLPIFILMVPLLSGFAMPAATGMISLQNNNTIIPGASPSSSVTLSASQSDSASVSDTSSVVTTTSSSDTSRSGKVQSSTITTSETSSLTTTTAQEATSDGVEVIADDDFIKWLNEALDNPPAYKGKTVKIRGFVFRSDELANNEFVPARLCMVCCAADLAPCGFVCRSDDAQKWATDSWVWVTATIQLEYDSYYQKDVPVLIASKIEAAEKPKNEILYPY